MKNKTKPYKCRGYLFCLYELLELSISKIAEECGVCIFTIWSWLKKFDIKRRTFSESLIGDKHPNWKGNDIKSIKAIHKRIREQKPKPVDGKCEICHKIIDKYGKTKLELSNIIEHHYTLNLDDYQYAHHSCHKSYDNKKRKERKTKISKAKISKNTNQVSYWLKIDKDYDKFK